MKARVSTDKNPQAEILEILRPLSETAEAPLGLAGLGPGWEVGRLEDLVQ
jgi:hypothetical protein